MSRKSKIYRGRSFKVKGSKDERVDIEVLGGKAFVKNDENE